MEILTGNRERKRTTTGERSVRCVFCRDPIVLANTTHNSGVCRLCAAEVEVFGWRTVYDREQNFGQIPRNLRAAYKL
jgi:hypothetical protein